MALMNVFVEIISGKQSHTCAVEKYDLVCCSSKEHFLETINCRIPAESIRIKLPDGSSFNSFEAAKEAAIGIRDAIHVVRSGHHGRPKHLFI